MKKILALLLAVLMVASLFAGCGSKTEAPASSGSQTSGTGSQSAASGEIPTLKWVTVGSGMPSNYDAWKANLDKYLEEKIGIHLDIEVVGAT